MICAYLSVTGAKYKLYTANVKETPTGLNIGSLAYNPDKVMMCKYDGNSIYTELENKINGGGLLSDTDMLKLIFLPLMRNTIACDALAVKSIELAQTIPDKTKRNTCIAAAFAFANRYLKDKELLELLEVLKMTDLATMLVEDAVKDEKRDIAKNLLRLKTSIDIISQATGLDESTIKQLQSELENK